MTKQTSMINQAIRDERPKLLAQLAGSRSASAWWRGKCFASPPPPLWPCEWVQPLPFVVALLRVVVLDSCRANRSHQPTPKPHTKVTVNKEWGEHLTK